MTTFLVILGLFALGGMTEAGPTPSAERFWWRKGNWTSTLDPAGEALLVVNQGDGNQQLEGSLTYVCRALYGGQKIPGTLVGGKQECHIGYDGAEVSIPEGSFEVLKEDGPEKYIWTESSGGGLVNGTVVAGFSKSMEPYFICRAKGSPDGNVFYAGKLQPSTRACFVPSGGSDKSFDMYDVLQEAKYSSTF